MLIIIDNNFVYIYIIVCFYAVTVENFYICSVTVSRSREILNVTKPGNTQSWIHIPTSSRQQRSNCNYQQQRDHTKHLSHQHLFSPHSKHSWEEYNWLKSHFLAFNGRRRPYGDINLRKIHQNSWSSQYRTLQIDILKPLRLYQNRAFPAKRQLQLTKNLVLDQFCFKNTVKIKSASTFYLS